MVDLYLIAHRCRGEATFDVAERIRCGICGGVGGHNVLDFETGESTDYEGSDCVECDGVGFWWILSTCGYRAHPWWSCLIEELDFLNGKHPDEYLGVMPTDSLDCFPINSPSHKSLPDRSNDLLAKLNLIPKGAPLRRLR